MLITHKKLQPMQCYHILSDSRDVYLSNNCYDHYSPQMVPTNPPGSWPNCSPSYSTPPFMPSCSCRVMFTNLGGHPSRARHAHRASQFTESNALVRSINAKQKSRPCYLHFSCTCRAGAGEMSVVPRPGLKPHCVSGIILSERGCSRLRRTFARIFPAPESREMPR